MLELLFVLFIFIGTLKKMLLVLSLVLVLKQQFSKFSFIELTNGKQIEIKNRTYYCYNDIMELEKFESNLLKIDKKS